MTSFQVSNDRWNPSSFGLRHSSPERAPPMFGYCRVQGPLPPTRSVFQVARSRDCWWRCNTFQNEKKNEVGKKEKWPPLLKGSANLSPKRTDRRARPIWIGGSSGFVYNIRDLFNVFLPFRRKSCKTWLIESRKLEEGTFFIQRNDLCSSETCLGEMFFKGKKKKKKKKKKKNRPLHPREKKEKMRRTRAGAHFIRFCRWLNKSCCIDSFFSAANCVLVIMFVRRTRWADALQLEALWLVRAQKEFVSSSEQLWPVLLRRPPRWTTSSWSDLLSARDGQHDYPERHLSIFLLLQYWLITCTDFLLLRVSYGCVFHLILLLQIDSSVPRRHSWWISPCIISYFLFCPSWCCPTTTTTRAHTHNVVQSMNQ